MNWASDEMLAERRLRSSELALETTRGRLVEANDEIVRLHARIVELEAALDEAREQARSLGRPEVIRLELAREQARSLAFEQALADERERRQDLERELEPRGCRGSDVAALELHAAQRRAERLEGELEVVRRHAAEFEQAIRVAIDDAWGWLAGVHDRLQVALDSQRELHELAVGSAGRGTGDRSRGVGGAGAADAAGGGAAIDAARLDLARSRLRETPGGGEPPSAMIVAPPQPRGPLSRLLYRRRARS